MRHKKSKIAFITLIVLIIVAAASFFIYVSQYYKADDVTVATIKASDSFEYHNNYVVFSSSTQTDDKALIFYPGGKVEYFAYFPLLEKLSQNGIMCVLVKMPFNLAVFNINAADEIINDFSNIDKWYIGGHSLGGAMASSYASDNQDKIYGLILLGAYVYGDYPKDRSITIYGSNDTILKRSKVNYTENVFVIEGGNHAQFGNYGLQKGDGIAVISQERQQDITEQYIVDFMK